jgi:hypothetical protein
VRKVFAPTTVWLDGGTLEEMSDSGRVAHQLGAIQEQEVAETEKPVRRCRELALETNVFIAKGTGKSRRNLEHAGKDY